MKIINMVPVKKLSFFMVAYTYTIIIALLPVSNFCLQLCAIIWLLLDLEPSHVLQFKTLLIF